MSEKNDEMSGGNKTKKKTEASRLGARWERPNNIIIRWGGRMQQEVIWRKGQHKIATEELERNRG
jgi:hypothetical protein